MDRNLSIAIIFVICGVSSVCAEIPDIEQARSEFEKLATELPYLSLSSVLYNRPGHHFRAADPKTTEECFRILGNVTDGRYDKDTLLHLLTNGDAKVRTLAAVALFDREDPTVLPSLVELCDDNSKTFDGHPELSATWLSMTGIGPPAKKQTVGDVATKMVSFYMTRSGFHYGIAHKTQPGFAEYWSPRKKRSHCAAWFVVQLARASQGTSPTRTACDRIRGLRKRIDNLPPDESAWILMWLNGESGSDALATEEELIEACKTIGPDKLLLMLQNKIPSDDPDLQPRTSNNWPYKRMQLFVLRHANKLLRREDSDALLEYERWHMDYQKHGISDPMISAWWAVAAANLEPANARSILHAAMDLFQGKHDADERSTLIISMWQLGGKSELKFITNWFFKESPERGSFPNCRGSFIMAMGKEANGRNVVAHILKDKRLGDIDWQSLERLVRVVNAWTTTPIVTEDEFRKAWHPLGQGHYHWEKGKAKKDYPKETEELQRHLSDWRKRLRMSIPELLEGDKKSESVEQPAAQVQSEGAPSD